MDFEDIPAAEDEVQETTGVPQETYDFAQESYEAPQETFEAPQEYNAPQEADYAPQEAANFLPEPEAEEDALTKFNKEWNLKLEQKRQAEFEQEKAVRAASEEDKTNWNTQHDIKLKAKKDSNRAEEAVLKEQLTSEAENLKTWERVSKLIDNGEAVDNKGSDTARMRKLFIQLKNEPLETTRAAAVANQ